MRDVTKNREAFMHSEKLESLLPVAVSEMEA